MFLPEVRIGRNVYIDKATELSGFNLVNDNARLLNVKLGKYSYISPCSIIIKANIGRYSSVGPACLIGLGAHSLDEFSLSPYIYNPVLFKKSREEDFEQVNIGNDVWIGANVIILGGITIGDGAAIGAGSVVTKDVPPFSVTYGNPAAFKRYRFPLEVQDSISASKWWDLELDEAKECKTNLGF